MRRFEVHAAHAQRFLSVHGITQNLFRVGRHLVASNQPANAAGSCVSGLERGNVCLTNLELVPTTRRAPASLS